MLLKVCELNKRISFFVIPALIVVIVAAGLFVSYEAGFLFTEGSRVLWQRNIENFATGLAATDGRVFTIDIWGNISCYDAQSGDSVWNGSIGAYWGAGLAVSETRVYGGKAYAEVGALNKSNGEFQYSFHVISGSQYSKRAPDRIIVEENRVFATTDGFGVYNATTGQLLWEAWYGNITDQRTWWIRGYPLGGVPFEGKFAYALGGDPSVDYVFKFDTEDGTVLWRSNITLVGFPVNLAFYQEQLVIQNGDAILSLNKTTGDSMWSFDVGAVVYQPTEVFSDLLFFGASDGNFYSLQLANGTLAWKTHVDAENLLSLVNSDNSLTVFPIQVDSENERVFYDYGVTEALGTTSENKHDRFTGFLNSLDLNTGNIMWTRKIGDSGVFFNPPPGLVANKNSVFLTANYGLWVFNELTGSLLGVQHFDHYVLPPVLSDSRVFVAADLHLTAYD